MKNDTIERGATEGEGRTEVTEQTTAKSGGTRVYSGLEKREKARNRPENKADKEKKKGWRKNDGGDRGAMM